MKKSEKKQIEVVDSKNLYQWMFFSDGYFEAAESIFNQYNVDHFPEKKFLLPMMMLYRHSVELAAKSTLIELTKIDKELGNVMSVCEIIKSSILYGHKLVKPWNEIKILLKSLMKRLQETRNASKDKIVLDESVLDEITIDFEYLQSIDANSMLFRYPTDRRGIPNFDEQIIKTSFDESIDKEQFRSRTITVLNFLKNIEAMCHGLAQA